MMTLERCGRKGFYFPDVLHILPNKKVHMFRQNLSPPSLSQNDLWTRKEKESSNFMDSGRRITENK